MKITDKHILQIANSETESFKMFYDAFSPSLAVFSVQMLNSNEYVEDVVSESMMVFWDRRTEFSTANSAKAFIYGVARNKCLNILRSRKRVYDIGLLQELPGNDLLVKSHIIREEACAELERVINDLAPRSQNILKLSIEGFKNLDIAERMGISINTVKTLKLRAYKTIREKFNTKGAILVFLLLIYIN